MFNNPDFRCYLHQNGGVSAISYRNRDDRIKVKFQIEPSIVNHWDWNTLCYGTTNKLNRVALNGNLILNNTRKEQGTNDKTSNKISYFEFGTFKDSEEGGSGIWFTDFNVWSGEMTTNELINYSRPCRMDKNQFKLLNLIMDWEIVTPSMIETKGPNVEVEVMPLTDICQRNVLEYFSQRLTFEASVQACLGLGGELYLPKNQTDLDHLERLFPEKQIWVPITFVQGSWMSLDGKGPAGFLPWGKNEPDNSQFEKCAMIKNGGFHDVSCERLEAFVCSFNKENIFALRGFPWLGKGHHFFINHDIKFNENIVFEGLTHRFVLFDSNLDGWILYDGTEFPKTQSKIDSNLILALDSNKEDKDGIPIGRETWKLIHPSGNETAELSFTQV